jgi:regulatory protein
VKITSIKQQAKQSDRYSIFVEGKYSFSLSEGALIENKLASGQELSSEQVKEFKRLSTDDKLYHQALRYVAIRLRTEWEISFYLQRKQASPSLISSILNKLRNIDLINDEKYARSFVNDRKLLRPTSRRKLIAELKKKRISDEIIQKVLGDDKQDDQVAIQEVIVRKRRQTKYQDDLKLMQYLARQGFNYDDIKRALQKTEDS